MIPGTNLAVAVPAAIDTVATWPTERIVKEADGYADTIASGVDVLWATPEAAAQVEISPDRVREAVVYGLAVLAHRPGGVTFAGLHWHANTCDDCPGPGTWSLPASATDRQDRGAFFTPRTLADEIVHNTVGPHASGGLDSFATTRIADIACGSGAFLLAAARYVTGTILTLWDDRDAAYFRKWHQAPDDRTAATRMALACLYGVDVDPLSVELARVALALLIPTEPVELPNIRVGDALAGPGNPAHGPALLADGPSGFDWPAEFPDVFGNPGDAACGFEVVVGNPPYLGGRKLTGTLGRPYVDHLIRTVADGRRGSADLAVYFYLRAHNLASRWGTVGIIGPVNLTRGGNARVWEQHLASLGWTAYRFDDHRPWPSKSAAVACCIRYTANLLGVADGFAGYHPDDTRAFKYPDLRHTCGFDQATHRAVEQLPGYLPVGRHGGAPWPMGRGCPRCVAVDAGEGWQVEAVLIAGKLWEGIRYGWDGVSFDGAGQPACTPQVWR